MKKLILILGMFLAILNVRAQEITQAEITKEVNYLNKMCGLTSAQAKDVRPAVEQYLKARKINKQNYGGDTKELNRFNKEAHDNYLNQLRQVLDSNQIDKLKPKERPHRVIKEKTPHQSAIKAHKEHNTKSEKTKKQKDTADDKKPGKRKKKDE